MDGMMNGLMASAMQMNERMEDPGSGSTTSLSNTVCISDPDGDWATVDAKAVEELSQFGEIARLDTSLSLVLRCILVTYFDVRCAQRALLKWAGRTEPFLPAAHDCRIVRVKLQAFAEKLGGLKGFGQFGEVANISMHRGDAIVEFYDMRAAQFLLASVGSCATPWTAAQAEQASAAVPRGMRAADLFPKSVPGGLDSLAPPSLGTSPAMNLEAHQGYSNAFDMQAGDPSSNDAYSKDGYPVEVTPQSEGEKPKPGTNRPVRTKVTTREFQMYDIDPAQIESGEDSRTTVMVRNLSWQTARKDFLAFLDSCDLSESYTFFYMPCKEHRNVPAGFAFLNLCSPTDVLTLYSMVTNGSWKEFVNNPSAKAPAVSYARFQGHEALAKHFSSSAVLHEQDPEKRPIFKVNAGKDKGPGKKAQGPKVNFAV